MLKVYSTHCCALAEIDNLSKLTTPKEALIAALPSLLDGIKPLGREWAGPHRAPLVLFTGVTQRRLTDHASGRDDDYGQAFAAYIVDNKLGDVVSSFEARNWTNNDVRAWIWRPDYDALKAWKAIHDPLQVQSL